MNDLEWVVPECQSQATILGRSKTTRHVPDEKAGDEWSAGLRGGSGVNFKRLGDQRRSMRFRFNPQRFPDRVIFIDTTTSPAVELMNCLGCGTMTGTLFKSDELCDNCYREWSLEFCKDWLRVRFGAHA